jgi:hypothetical protein
MQKHYRAQKQFACQAAAWLLMCLATVASGAPAIQSVAGTFSHKATVTVSGSGFGSKAAAAPVIWDDASGTDMLAKWSGTWPARASDASYNLAYRAPLRGISLPHSNITKYIAGCGIGGDATSGQNIMMWKSRVMTAYPAYSYFSWYQRSDDLWIFGGDNNYKVWDFSNGAEPYDLPNNWYIEYNPVPNSLSAVPYWHINDDAYPNGLNGNVRAWWGGEAINPMSGAWTKIELEIRYDKTSGGYIKLWENGALKINYAGRTDGLPGNIRAEAVGGFQREHNSSAWRYFADVYLDYTPARVVLANQPVLSQASVIEPQIPSAWSAAAITFSVNLGKFTAGQTAYLFVIDAAGHPSAAGFPITVGRSAGNRLPPPQNLRIL